MQLNYSNYGILMRNQVQKLCKKNNKSASRKPRHEIQGLVGGDGWNGVLGMHFTGDWKKWGVKE